MDIESGETSLKRIGDFTVVEDGAHLRYGSKMRGNAFMKGIKDEGFKGVVTSGTTHGYGQAAIAWMCKKNNIKCTIFINKVIPRTEMSQAVIDMGCNLVEVGNGRSYTRGVSLQKKVDEFAKNHPEYYPLPSGLYDIRFIEAMYTNIFKVRSLYQLELNEIWVAGGTGVVAASIGKAFPGVKINIVQVGKMVWKDVISEINYKIWYYPKELGSFVTPAAEKPPFEALANYDAKVWYMVRRYGKPGDLIWIVK